MANEAISQRPRIVNVNGEDLLPVSQKQFNGKFKTCAIPASEIMGKSAYYTWIEQNTTIEQYFNNTTIQNIIDQSTINNIQQIIEVTNLTNEYNTWVTNNTYNSYQNLSNYIFNNEYNTEYKTYVTNNNTNNIINNMVNFIEYKNITNDYRTYVNNLGTDTSLSKFISTLNSLELYYGYLKTHPSTPIDQFLAFLNLQEQYNEWVQQKLLTLTEDDFIKDLKGFDGTGSVLNKFTEIWLCASGIYIAPQPVTPTPENPNPQQLEMPKEFGLIVIPERTFIKFDRIHRMKASNPDTVVLMKGKFKLKKENGQTTNLTEIELALVDDEIEYTPSFELTDLITIEAGTVISFEFANEPNHLDSVGVTFLARKVRSYSSSVNGLMLSGLWSAHDSVLGECQIFDSQLRGYRKLETSYIESFFKNNAKTTPFNKVYAATVQRGENAISIVNINNTSRIRRILTLKPESFANNQGKGTLLSDRSKLPVNVDVLPDGSIQMILEGWED
ncbi:hypothetical protein [Acinetobacter modestus]|uniref:hypothetical protein n=1 Tax=Acinetobacter modestus TaxID=1776740 RepID=UPI003016D98F